MTLDDKEGDVGEQGEVGARGEQGDAGVRGERGPQGDPGARGDHGQPGDAGARGPGGPAGAVTHDESRERKRDRKALYRAASLLALPVAILALIPSIFGVYLTQREIKHNCMEGNKNRAALRLTLQDAARRTATSKQRTQQEKAEAKAFYAAALARLPINPC